MAPAPKQLTSQGTSERAEKARDAGSAPVLASPNALADPVLEALAIPSATADCDSAFLLGSHAGALDLRPPGEHARRGIQALFPPDRATGRSRSGQAARNPLLRAFGKQIHSILDLTAGLGGDAYRLAEAGHRVRAFERHPAVYAVLASGWERAVREETVSAEIRARLVFEHGDGGEQIAALEEANLGIYIDPMYPPPRRSSAKPRRALQVLRALLGRQDDAADLVTRSREKAARVVVKRPHHADSLVPDVSFVIETKLVRFDVYVNPERMGDDRRE